MIFVCNAPDAATPIPIRVSSSRNMESAFENIAARYASKCQMKTSSEKQTNATAMIRKKIVHAVTFVSK